MCVVAFFLLKTRNVLSWLENSAIQVGNIVVCVSNTVLRLDGTQHATRSKVYRAKELQPQKQLTDAVDSAQSLLLEKFANPHHKSLSIPTIHPITHGSSTCRMRKRKLVHHQRHHRSANELSQEANTISGWSLLARKNTHFTKDVRSRCAPALRLGMVVTAASGAPSVLLRGGRFFE